MRLGIAVPYYQRPEVFKLFCAAIEEAMKKYDIVVSVTGSEGEASRRLCNRKNFMYRELPNTPVSRKWDIAIRVLRFKVDYVMILGSDDIPDMKFFDEIFKRMEKGYDFIGISDAYIYSLNHEHPRYGMFFYWGGYVHIRFVGMGRTYSAKLLDKVKWGLYDFNASKAMDAKSTAIIQPHIKTFSIFSLKDTDSLLVDIKTAGNISRSDYAIMANPEIIDPIEMLKPRFTQQQMNLLYDIKAKNDEKYLGLEGNTELPTYL